MQRLIPVAAFLALTVHLFSAADRALWEDEIATVRTAQSPLRAFPRAAAGAFETPIFTLLLKAWMTVTTSDVGLRVLPIVIALAGAAIAFAFFRRALPATAGAGAMVLLAVSPGFSLWSRDARPYGLFFALSVATAACWWYHVRKRSTAAGWAAAAFSTAAFWVHFAHLYQAVALALWPLIVCRGLGRIRGIALLAGPAITFGLAGILWPDWISGVIGHLRALQDAPASPHPGGFPGRLAFGLFAFTLGETLYPLNWVWVLPAIGAWTAAGFFGLRHLARVDRPALAFWLLWGLLPLTAFALGGARFTPRHALPSLAALLAVAATGAAAAPRSRLLFVLLLASPIWSSINDARGREHHNQGRVEPVREVAAWIRAQGFGPGDECVLAPQHDVLRWYLRDSGGASRTRRFRHEPRLTGRLYFVRCSAGHWSGAADEIAQSRREVERLAARLGPPDEVRSWGIDPLREEKERWIRKPMVPVRFEVWYWRRTCAP